MDAAFRRLFNLCHKTRAQKKITFICMSSSVNTSYFIISACRDPQCAFDTPKKTTMSMMFVGRFRAISRLKAKDRYIGWKNWVEGIMCYTRYGFCSIWITFTELVNFLLSFSRGDWLIDFLRIGKQIANFRNYVNKFCWLNFNVMMIEQDYRYVFADFAK